MSSPLFRRCGCRREDGRQYAVLPVTNPTPAQRAAACPAMSDPKHGMFSWRLSNGYDPRTGTRRRINGKSYTTRKEAEKALNAARVAKDQGRVTGSSPTLAAYAVEYLHRRTTTGKVLAVTTAFNYEHYWIPAITGSTLGRMRLDRITRKDVRGFVSDLTTEGRGAPTIERVLRVLAAILALAVEDELLIANPAARVKGPAVARPDQATLEPADVLRFLRVAGEHRLGPVYELLLHTALRRGELCGLRWQDVDLDDGTARIAQTRVKLGGRTVTKGTKTDASATEVELSGAAVEALRVIQLRQQVERAEWGEAWTDTGYVVTMEDGNPADPDYVSKLFGKLLARTEKDQREEAVTALAKALRQERPDLAEDSDEFQAEVAKRLEDTALTFPAMTLHGLRHTAASWAWDSTGDLLAVSKLLRHASTKTTEAVYVHMRSGKNRATAETISRALQRASVHTMDHTSPLAG